MAPTAKFKLTTTDPMSGGAIFGTILGVLLLIFMVLWIYRKGAQDNNLPAKILKGTTAVALDDKDDLEIVSPMHRRP
jgi:hypothetical protein